MFTFFRNTLIATLFVLTAVKNFAQSTKAFTAKNGVFAELATPGTDYSINYERFFSEANKFTKSFRVGFGVTSKAIGVPLGLNFISGKKENHLEYHLVITPIIENYSKLFASGNLSDKKLTIAPGAGYRYQQPDGGIFLKVIASSVLLLDPPSNNFWRMDTQVYFSVSASIGYSF